MRRRDRRKAARVKAFRQVLRVEGLDDHAGAGRERRRHRVEHRLHDRRHPRHDDDVADPEARRLRDRVLDEVGALRDAGHAQARLVEVLGAVTLEHHRPRPLVDVDRHAEGLGDAIGRDVVVRRADAAGREQVGVARAQGIDRGDDLLLDVRHDADFPEIDADVRQVLGDVADVLVLGAPGQDLVPDHEEGGGDGLGHWRNPFRRV